MEEMLITADTVLPISSEPIGQGGVLVAGGEIGDVGEAQELRRKHPRAERVELGRGVLLPALINAHAHLELSWIRERLGTFRGFTDWIAEIIKAKRDDPGVEKLRHSVREGIGELIRGGVGTVGEISSFGGVDAPLLKGSGLRTVLFTELFDRDELWLDGANFGGEGLFEARPFPHAPYSCSPEFLHKVAQLGRGKRLPIGIHLGESRDEVRFLRGEPNGFEQSVFPLLEREPFPRARSDSPYRYMERVGFFRGNRATLVHMIHVSDEEVDDLARREIGVVLCPRSNSFLRVGAPPLEKLSGLKRIGIGTDGMSSNYDLNLLEELRFTHLLSSPLLAGDAACFCVYLATLGGARALFLEDRIGSIERGKQADLVFLSPRFPSSDPYLSVISCGKEDVGMVMVGGRVLHSRPGDHPRVS